jgi:hypothetical protein
VEVHSREYFQKNSGREMQPVPKHAIPNKERLASETYSLCKTNPVNCRLHACREREQRTVTNVFSDLMKKRRNAPRKPHFHGK